MAREEWTKKSSRKSRTSSVDGNDRKWKKPVEKNKTKRQPSSPRLVAGIDPESPPCVPKPTRTICDLTSKQNWAEALQRCQTHPQDMDYADVRGTMLHFALWSCRRVNQTPEDEATYCCFIDTLMAHNSNVIFVTGSLGYTPLHIACSKDATRKSAIVATLLKRSVPVGAEILQDIMISEREAKVEDTENSNRNRLPRLPPEVFHRIVRYLPNAALIKDSQGKTPLFLACQVSKNVPRRDKSVTGTLKEVVKLLVEAAPEAKGMADKTGRTPLEVVRKQKRFHELEDVLSSGKEVVDLQKKVRK